MMRRLLLAAVADARDEPAADRRAAALAVEVQVTPPLEQLVTRATVAHWLNVSQATVDREARDGALVHVRIRGTVRFRPEDVRRYLLSRHSENGRFDQLGGRDSNPDDQLQRLASCH